MSRFKAPPGRSINRKLTLILVSVLVLSAFMALLRGYNSSMEQADSQLDAHLQSIAALLLNAQFQRQQVIELTNDNDLYYLLYYEQNLVLGSKALVQGLPVLTLQSGFSTQNVNGMRLRTYTEQKGANRVVVAEPIQKRFALAEGLIISAMTPLIVVMPLLAVFIAWMIYNALLPLRKLSKELRQRSAKDFSQLTTHSSAAEVAPVIGTINALFEKVEVAYLKERYFASDAAHELKTPIASLKIHLHNLANDVSHGSIEALEQGLSELNHVVEQMLTLARTEPEVWHQQFSLQNVDELTQNLVAQMYSKIEKKHLSISLDAEDLQLMGCEFTLTTLFSNLLSNAIKYTPKQGEIRIRILQHKRYILWQINDSGVGMSKQQIERVFDRFYRVGGDKHPSGEKGAGLGMAIVSHIVKIYQAEITLQPSEFGGLCVQVKFPRSDNDE
ncbi:ATP-binding protein (plasmid) [Pseudoalteromonas sp. T1lg65]|uniref:ATP-binding protein n=1 Tax=Pseudoalteromonas sp. T1lg65 TaxID=2077101 RepID=UPI003F78B9D1